MFLISISSQQAIVCNNEIGSYHTMNKKVNDCSIMWNYMYTRRLICLRLEGE